MGCVVIVIIFRCQKPLEGVSDGRKNPLRPGGAYENVRVGRLTFQVGAFRHPEQQEQGLWEEESWVPVQIPPNMAVALGLCPLSQGLGFLISRKCG